MIKKLTLLIIIAVTVAGCGPLKRLKTVTQGKVETKNYSEEIPFNYYYGLIFIEIEISGRKYNFIFDTGADLTLIDDDLQNAIKYKSNNVAYAISDAGNNKKTSPYISVDRIKIGNIDFINTGAHVSDLSHFEEMFGCTKLDGIIGSNLMRKASWQIDYAKKVIRFTDDILNLKRSGEAHEFDTNSGRYGSIKLEVDINGKKRKFTFDTGYSGSLTANNAFFDELNTVQKHSYATLNYSGITAYGKASVKERSAYIPKLKMGGIELENQLVGFKDNGSNLLGNSFCENFTVTLDWKKEKLYLDPVKSIKSDTLRVFEVAFIPNYKTRAIEVYSYWDEHQLKDSLELGTKVISINGINVSGFTTAQLCDFWNSDIKSMYKNSSIDIEAVVNGQIKSYRLTKKQLLPK